MERGTHCSPLRLCCIEVTSIGVLETHCCRITNVTSRCSSYCSLDMVSCKIHVIFTLQSVPLQNLLSCAGQFREEGAVTDGGKADYCFNTNK